MKTQTWKNIFKTASVYSLAAIATLFVAACGKSGDSAAPMPVGPGVGYPTCATCAANSSFLASGAGRFYASGSLSFELALELFGNSQTMGTYGTQQPVPAGSAYYSQPMTYNYSGAISSQGTLTVVNVPYMSCNIPPGTYQVQTTQPGYFGNGQSFGSMSMQAIGPAQLEIVIENWGAWLKSAIPAVQTLDGRQFPYKVQGRVWIRSTGAYMGQPQYPGYPQPAPSWCDFNIE